MHTQYIMRKWRCLEVTSHFYIYLLCVDIKDSFHLGDLQLKRLMHIAWEYCVYEVRVERTMGDTSQAVRKSNPNSWGFNCLHYHIEKEEKHIITHISYITRDLNSSSPHCSKNSAKQLHALILVTLLKLAQHGHRPVPVVNSSLSTLRPTSSPIWRRFPKIERLWTQSRSIHMHTAGLNNRHVAQVHLLSVSQWTPLWV